jgi:PhnB protein
LQRIVPMLPYADASAAIAFLCRAFGFEQRFRYDMPDGRVGHAELELGGDVVMVSNVWREGGLTSPLELPALHAQTYCRVDDVDAHFARARAAGATLIGAPEDQEHGSRSYRAVDLEGHRWIFAGPLKGS